MSQENFSFSYEVFSNSGELAEADRILLEKARTVTAAAYAPYSKFYVGAVAKLANGEEVTGTNQENASSPVGICAERVLLSTASTMFPGIAVDTLAISYHNRNADSVSDHPVSPCGLCRQSLSEYEERMKSTMRIILSGMEGKVIILRKAADLLPLSFGSTDLK